MKKSYTMTNPQAKGNLSWQGNFKIHAVSDAKALDTAAKYANNRHMSLEVRQGDRLVATVKPIR